MYHLECKCRLMKKDRFVMGEGRARILRLIAVTGSISEAAKGMNMSYRHAWGEVKAMEKAVGEPLVRTRRGGEDRGGTELTEPGRELLDVYHRLREAHEDVEYRRAGLTVDGIVVDRGRILLIRRKNAPFQDEHALPGGFVEYGESVEDAVVREVEEETGLKTEIDFLVGVYSEPGRDPRGHVVSVVFSLHTVGGELKSGSDAHDVHYFELSAIPSLAFDHGKIIKDYLRLSGNQSVSDLRSLQ